MTTARSTELRILPSARWLVWPEMNDQAAERANGDTHENGEKEDRRADRNKYLHQL